MAAFVNIKREKVLYLYYYLFCGYGALGRAMNLFTYLGLVYLIWYMVDYCCIYARWAIY